MYPLHISRIISVLLFLLFPFIPLPLKFFFFFFFFKLEYFKANPKAPFTTNMSIIGMKRLLCGPVFLFL